MKKIAYAINLLLLLLFVCPAKAQTDQRWPKQKIWDWYNKQPFYCGFNDIPAYAINYTAIGASPCGSYSCSRQHDLSRGDFTPYDPQEIELLKDFALKSRNSSCLQEHQK